MARTPKTKVSVFDFETDPFLFGRVPQPFAAGFFDGQEYRDFWGDDCCERFVEFIAPREPLCLYAHNGGKFDFFYLLERGLIHRDCKIINGRIVEARITNTPHILRDSFAILPVPLDAYQKDEINYDWFEREKRDQYRNEILHYLAADCEYLYDLVTRFIDRFGRQLTIGGTAIKRLRKMHPFDNQTESHDKTFRPYYFGGRCEAFEPGDHKRDVFVYDVNSMYPKVMRDFDHPTGRDHIWTTDLDRALDAPMFFIKFHGRNYGAIPQRTPEGNDYNIERGEFCTTSHEFRVAVKYGLIEVEDVREILIPCETIRFAEFVDTYIQEKIAAKKSEDKAGEIFAKLLLNSSYGKFAQNPEKYRDWAITLLGEPHKPPPWELELLGERVRVWSRPSPGFRYLDVATAASITGGSRAILLEAIQNADRPIYCDTDSLICDGLRRVDIDDYRLGAWKLEAQGDRAAVAGKKLYAVWKDGDCVKMASKGVSLAPTDILEIVKGEQITCQRAAPTFSILGGMNNFTERRVKMLQRDKKRV